MTTADRPPFASMPVIQLMDEPARDGRTTSSLVFIGGTLDGVRREHVDPPDLIEADGESYRRSVRCADDGALRYVLETATGGSKGDDAA